MANVKSVQMITASILQSVFATRHTVVRIVCSLVRSTTRAIRATATANARVTASAAVTMASWAEHANSNALSKTSKCVHHMENALSLLPRQRTDRQQSTVIVTEALWALSATWNALPTLRVSYAQAAASVTSTEAMLYASVRLVLEETTASTCVPDHFPATMCVLGMVSAMHTQQTPQLGPCAPRVTKATSAPTAL
jgi:hypothetical protein